MRHALLVLTLVLGASILASTANASELIDRNAAGISFGVNAKGEALVSYHADGKSKHVLVWGALNAISPTRSRPQLSFKLDYSGGYGKYKQDYWKTFKSTCNAYDGPALAWKVTACKASDGSYWALQKWQRMLPNYGLAPSPAQAVWELRLSHWTGDVPVLTIDTDWAWHQWDHLFGSFTYGDQPVFGYKSTPAGVPLDTFGRNIYVDTFNSRYGSGWKRENSFLAHRFGGTFCYGFFPHGSHPAGRGTKYRATIIGAGVTPDVLWEGPAPGSYNRAADQTANEDQRANFRDGTCKVN